MSQVGLGGSLVGLGGTWVTLWDLMTLVGLGDLCGGTWCLRWDLMTLVGLCDVCENLNVFSERSN